MEWLYRLSKAMASGYGADRGCNPTQVRSGVFRGALLALLPLIDSYIPEFEDGDELVMLGADGMKANLTKNKFLPLP